MRNIIIICNCTVCRRVDDRCAKEDKMRVDISKGGSGLKSGKRLPVMGYSK